MVDLFNKILTFIKVQHELDIVGDEIVDIRQEI